MSDVASPDNQPAEEPTVKISKKLVDFSNFFFKHIICIIIIIVIYKNCSFKSF